MRHPCHTSVIFLIAIFLVISSRLSHAAVIGNALIQGPMIAHHPFTLTITGPKTSETANPNPFRDYHLTVTFTHQDKSYIVPGYFAADGNAAQTSATSGDQWRTHFVPDKAGKWSFKVSFHTAKNIAITNNTTNAKTVKPHGHSGSFRVRHIRKTDRSHWRHGKLRYVGKRYWQYAASKRYFLKGGADSPENLLAYVDLDGTKKNPKPRKNKQHKTKLHTYKPHLRDFKSGDPTWKDGKGKALIGALNYLASKGMNSVYFLTMNVHGDGDDVWPWIESDIRDRFDCSKLDQWNIIFNHMDSRGLALHVITQETENDQLLDGGELGPIRKLYLRELIARFAHHQAVVWNLGEENTNTTQQIKQYCNYIKSLDTYKNPIVIHTYPNQKTKVYNPLLGFKKLEGPSLQYSNDWHTIHESVRHWVSVSEKKGYPWVVNVDEPGTAKFGVDHDAKKNNNQPIARKTALWGALMAGGGGVEWYFGYANPHNDLNLEDFRSRDKLWDQTRYAIEFFQQNLPFAEMNSADQLIIKGNAFALAKPGHTYALYLPNGGSATIDLSHVKGEFSVYWYNPRTGDPLQQTQTRSINAPAKISVGAPPDSPKQDWAVYIRANGDTKIIADLPKPNATIPASNKPSNNKKPTAIKPLPRKAIPANAKIFTESNGLIAVEAEHFSSQRAHKTRRWYITSASSKPTVKPDPDPSHHASASGKAYLEILPDTRVTHADKLTHGVNFSNKAGQMAILDYHVKFNTPGRYYVWVRAYSSGSEDNGIHVGINNTWPATGQRLQWCKGKRSWWWESKQRTQKNHCGEPYKIFLDIPKPGFYTISFSMREDGFEFDKFLLTRDRNFKRPTDAGPKSTLLRPGK